MTVSARSASMPRALVVTPGIDQASSESKLSGSSTNSSSITPSDPLRGRSILIAANTFGGSASADVKNRVTESLRFSGSRGSCTEKRTRPVPAKVGSPSTVIIRSPATRLVSARKRSLGSSCQVRINSSSGVSGSSTNSSHRYVFVPPRLMRGLSSSSPDRRNFGRSGTSSTRTMTRSESSAACRSRTRTSSESTPPKLEADHTSSSWVTSSSVPRTLASVTDAE